MKKKNLSVVSVLLVNLALAFTWAAIGFTQGTEKSGLSLRGKSNQETYILGEPVTVEFAFVNEGRSTIKVSAFGVETGGLKVFIASERDREYKEYFGSGWGRKRGNYAILEPRRSLTLTPATILWNGKPNVSHLNEDAAKLTLAGKLTTEYAFDEAGTYFIKGVSYFGGDGSPIESEPVRIQVREPDAANSEVWKKIKGNREIAFLMQKGSFDASDELRKQEVIATVDQIVLNYPVSVYSSYLRPNLEKFKIDEARRKEAMQKAVIKPQE